MNHSKAFITLLGRKGRVARLWNTASLQATKIAEGVYAAVGFRDLGRIFEYVPRGLT